MEWSPIKCRLQNEFCCLLSTNGTWIRWFHSTSQTLLALAESSRTPGMLLFISNLTCSSRSKSFPHLWSPFISCNACQMITRVLIFPLHTLGEEWPFMLRGGLLWISSCQDLWICLPVWALPLLVRGRVWHHFHTRPWKDQQRMVKASETQLSMADTKKEKPKTPKAAERKSSHFSHNTVQSELYSFIFWVAAAS